MDKQGVWYMVLQIGIPFLNFREDPSRHLRTVSVELEKIGIERVRRIDLHCGRDSQSTGRYMFRFRRHRRDDASAIRLSEAFLYGMSLFHGPVLESHFDSLVLPLPSKMIGRSSSLQIDDAVALEESRLFEERWLNRPWATIATTYSTLSETHEAAWRVATVTFGNDALFDSVRFLNRSHNNFYVWPGDLRDVMDDGEAVARTSLQQTNFEDALQNAFKAIEAIIGDPSKNDRKLHQKLLDIGINPELEAGHGEKHAIPTWIRKMNKVRDQRSAHGSTRPRTIRVVDMLNFQECSRLIVIAALEKAHGAPIFP